MIIIKLKYGWSEMITYIYLIKLKRMNLSIKELNDLYYCVGMMRIRENVKMISNEELEKLSDKIWFELVERNKEEENEAKQ